MVFTACTKSDAVAPSAKTPALGATARRDAVDHDVNDDNLPKHSGKDDPANHNANDDNLPKHSGKDDPANHNANDDNLPKHSGKDDSTNHK